MCCASCLQLPKVEELSGISRPHLPDAYHPLARSLLLKFMGHAQSGAYALRQLSACLWVVAKLSLWRPGASCHSQAIDAACLAAHQMREQLSYAKWSQAGGRSLSGRQSRAPGVQGPPTEQQHRGKQPQDPELLQGSCADSSWSSSSKKSSQRQWVAQPPLHGRLHPQDVSNTAWAVAQLLMGLLPHLAEQQDGKMGEEVEDPMLGDPTAGEEDVGPDPIPTVPIPRPASAGSGTSTAVAQLHLQLLALVPALATAAPGVMPAMGAQEAANTLWALAHFSRHLRRVAQSQQPGAELEEALQPGSWDRSLAIVNQAAGRVVKGLGRVVHQMQGEHIACCIWALATLGLRWVQAVILEADNVGLLMGTLIVQADCVGGASWFAAV
jgi:hypothetical protein